MVALLPEGKAKIQAAQKDKIAKLKHVKAFLRSLDKKTIIYHERIVRMGEKKLLETGAVDRFDVQTIFNYVNLERMFSNIKNGNSRKKVMSVYGKIYMYLKKHNEIDSEWEFPKEKDLPGIEP